MPFVYIVRCEDGTLYTGYAEDVERRVAAHNAGRGARYTSGRRPVRLVFSAACATRGEALRREYELKQLSRQGKEAVIRAWRAATRTARRRPATSPKRKPAATRKGGAAGQDETNGRSA